MKIAAFGIITDQPYDCDMDGPDHFSPRPGVDAPPWVPLARPVEFGTGFPPPIPAGPSREILLLRQSRRTVIADVLIFIFTFVPLSLAGEIVLAEIYRAVEQLPAAESSEGDAELSRAILFPVIGWRATVATVLCVVLARHRNLTLRSMGLTLRGFPMDVFLGLVTFGAIVSGVIFFSNLINMFAPKLFEGFQENAEAIKRAVPKVSPAGFAVVCLLIGYYEELIFRGFLLPKLRRLTGSWFLAILLTTALFAVLHLLDQEPAALLAITALSVVFSVVTIWRRSLIPAIIAHMLFNLMMLLQLFYTADQ